MSSEQSEGGRSVRGGGLRGVRGGWSEWKLRGAAALFNAILLKMPIDAEISAEGAAQRRLSAPPPTLPPPIPVPPEGIPALKPQQQQREGRKKERKKESGARTAAIRTHNGGFARFLPARNRSAALGAKTAEFWVQIFKIWGDFGNWNHCDPRGGRAGGGAQGGNAARIWGHFGAFGAGKSKRGGLGGGLGCGGAQSSRRSTVRGGGR